MHRATTATANSSIAILFISRSVSSLQSASASSEIAVAYIWVHRSCGHVIAKASCLRNDFHQIIRLFRPYSRCPDQRLVRCDLIPNTRIAAADGGVLRDRALALLKQGTVLADECSKRERGYSIWEPVFAEYDRHYPGKSKVDRWKRDRWPFYFERMPDSGLWVPFDVYCRPLVDHDRIRCFPAKQNVGLAWYWRQDPRSFGLRSSGGIWHKMYDNLLYLCDALGPGGKQDGDPRKAAHALDLALSAERTPLRLQVGADSIVAVRAHAEQLLADLAAWEKVGADIRVDADAPNGEWREPLQRATQAAAA